MLLLITAFCLHVRNTRTVQVHKLRLLRAYSTHAGREANSALYDSLLSIYRHGPFLRGVTKL